MLETKEKALACLAHLCIMFQLTGLAITLAIYFLGPDKSDFFRRSVEQAIGFQILIAIFVSAFRISLLFGMFVHSYNFLLPVLWALYALVILVAFYAAFKAFRGYVYEYPLTSRFVKYISE